MRQDLSPFSQKRCLLRFERIVGPYLAVEILADRWERDIEATDTFGHKVPGDSLKVVQITPWLLEGSKMYTQAPIDLKLLISRCDDIVLHVNNAQRILIRL